MSPVYEAGMLKAKLSVGGGGDFHSQSGEVPRFVFCKRKSERLCIHDHKTIPAKGSVDRYCAMPFDFERGVKFIRKRGEILYGDILCFSVTTGGPYPNKPPRSFEDK